MYFLHIQIYRPRPNSYVIFENVRKISSWSKHRGRFPLFHIKIDTKLILGSKKNCAITHTMALGWEKSGTSSKAFVDLGLSDYHLHVWLFLRFKIYSFTFNFFLLFVLCLPMLCNLCTLVACTK